MSKYKLTFNAKSKSKNITQAFLLIKKENYYENDNDKTITVVSNELKKVLKRFSIW